MSSASSSVFSASASGTAQSTSTSTSDATPVAVGVAIGAVVLLALAALGLWLWRRRRQAASDTVAPATHRHTSSAVNSSHLASHITPFGSQAGEQPRFVHRPGENMRIARRRSDGGWEFREQSPEPPMSPPPRFSLSTQHSQGFGSAKDTPMRPGEFTMRDYVELDGESHPPPAYQPPPPSSRAETSFLHD